MEQPRIERMLRLMKLMSGNTNYTIGELAKKLGITYRSVYRYIETFESSGFVVDKVRKNVYKLGKMPKGLVELVYSFEPFTEDMTDEEKSHILGIQANLWTEYIPTDAQLEYMLLPRLSALSEIQWCEPENKDYERFLGNMESMRKIYDILGYNYAKHIFSK